MIDLSTVDQDAEAFDYSKIGAVADYIYKTSGEQTDFTKADRELLIDHLKKVEGCKVILEIGVENNPNKVATSTYAILTNKDDDTYYFGVDIQDRRHLDNPDKKIYTIQARSENIEMIMAFLKSKGVEKIDFFFIDGWHSINQCKAEFFGYQPYLSENAIVGFHDTNHHFGPMWLVENIDRDVWEVVNYDCNPDQDFGIGFAWKK